MYESDDKMVSHPNHYQSETGLEVIDVIEAFTDGLMGVEATDTGNIIKYACRWKKKNGIQDLKKIMWYTQHLIEHLEKVEREPYGSYYDKENKKRDYGKTRTSSRDYNNIFLDNRADAEEVLMKMDELIYLYGVVSIRDFYDLVGKTGDYTDEKYGWTDIRSASIIRTYDNRYKIKLPRVLPID